MTTVRPQCPDSVAPDRAVVADLIFRHEPDEEEEDNEEEDEGDGGGKEDDDDDDDGYSE